MAEIIEREPIDTADQGGRLDHTQEVAGNQKQTISQDEDGRQVIRSSGTLTLDETTFKEEQDISQNPLELEPDTNNSRRVDRVLVNFSAPSSSTVRVIQKDSEDSDFNTVLREANLDNNEDFFWQPDNEMDLASEQTILVQVDQENGGPTAFATLGMEDV